MKLSLISEGLDFTIEPYNDDMDDANIGQACYSIAREAGINISRNKNLSLVAMTPSGPVGAVWAAWDRDSDASENYGKDVYCYNFDVAVSQSARASGMTSPRIGPQLIEAALDDYKTLRSEVPGAYIRVWVVNPKLASYLENKYGFEPDSHKGWTPGTPHMSYYG